MSEWIVVCKPVTVKSDDGKNLSGIVVKLRKGSKVFADEEVAHVGYDRTNSKNPRVSFEVQLAKVRKKAQVAADALNETGDVDEGTE